MRQTQALLLVLWKLGRRRPAALAAATLACLIALALSAQEQFTGRWILREGEQRVVLDLRQDAQTGRVTGTLTAGGAARSLEGQIQGSQVIVETLDGTTLSSDGLRMSREGNAVILTIPRADGDPVVWRMEQAAGEASPGPRASELPPPSSSRRGPAPAAQAFAGNWEALDDDGTAGEFVELEVSGERARGTITRMSRGYFSGQVTTDREVIVDGVFRDGALQVTLADSRDPLSSAAAILKRRGEFLVVEANGIEIGAYARPGRRLVEMADGSVEAASLAHTIRGNVYGASTEASGGGAFTGGRIRLALCADGRIELDASSLAATPGPLPGEGVDFGSTTTRRGRWSLVLLGGAPAVRADWEGTGSSYSLVAYIRIQPSRDGRGAIVDGTVLRVTGSC